MRMLTTISVLLVLSNSVTQAAGAKPAGSFTVWAHDFDAGNIRVSRVGQAYADKHPCIWNAEKYPNQAEYEIEFPVTAEYRFVALYAAHASRPVDIYLDGKKVHRGFAGVTGSWQTSTAKWAPQCTLRITKGVHTIKLLCPGPCMPHICAFRLESNVAFPKGWQLQRPKLARRRAREALARRLGGSVARLKLFNAEALRLAVRDLARTFPRRYAKGRAYLARIDALAGRLPDVLKALKAGKADAIGQVDEILALQREALLANPLLALDKLLLVKRGARSPALGLPQNWQSNCVLPRGGFDDEIAVLSPVAPDGKLTRLYKPKRSVFVGDVDLHWDGDRLLFSSIGTHNRWQVFEIGVDSSGLRQVTPGEHSDVDNYDACYLPAPPGTGGRIVFGSTRAFVSVPCVNGSTRVSNLFVMGGDGRRIRQLCFDQEHNWCPTVLADGRVMYLRWQYTDTPHTHDRVLFSMNPDGTEQRAVYGRNSYWPNALFYARPIPGSSTKLVGIVGGHHGVPRMGELVLFDVARGREEADGALQRIPGRGKTVTAKIEDNLVDASWPKFLHPWPLGEPDVPGAGGKYFLVACKPAPNALWGIYLADVFDNLTLIKELPGYALLEPIPLRPRPRARVIPDRVDLSRRDAVVYMANVYRGGGLAGIPRGTVKRLRVFTYTYLYPGMGGPQGVVGMEGPWDIRRIMGTVEVEADGSAMFRVPANMPISVQPLDESGAALQLMRSWMTAMPGEVLSCVGCHERQDDAPRNVPTMALRRSPRRITPWRGPTRGYSFRREVQPVLDKYCLGCHSGRKRAQGKAIGDLRGTVFIKDYNSRYHHGGRDAGKFSVGYAFLQRFVRRPGLESDARMLAPMETHVSTTQLVQMLRKGHHNVRLDAEAWDRLITWIDLNAPYHGSLRTIAGAARVAQPARRRREMLKRYADVDVDWEWTGPPLTEKVIPVPAKPSPPKPAPPRVAGWPFSPDEARRRQARCGKTIRQTVVLGQGVKLSLTLIPPGEFVVGSVSGEADESPATRVKIDQPFWIGTFEITNRQYAAFDPSHDSGVELRHAMQFGVRGWPLGAPSQPVVRVSWHRAMAFCRWLGKKTGRRFTLPTEAQWEYACRAGTATALSFGGLDADFSKHANVADVRLRDAVAHPYHKAVVPLPKPTKYDDWIPRDNRFNDGRLVSAPVGKYAPNTWGLHDMHGNVAEWTRTAYRRYPYNPADGRDGADATGERVARGGSWRDRPQRCRSAFRLPYRQYQRIYNVGFRVACPADNAVASR